MAWDLSKEQREELPQDHRSISKQTTVPIYTPSSLRQHHTDLEIKKLQQKIEGGRKHVEQRSDLGLRFNKRGEKCRGENKFMN